MIRGAPLIQLELMSNNMSKRPKKKSSLKSTPSWQGDTTHKLALQEYTYSVRNCVVLGKDFGKQKFMQVIIIKQGRKTFH